MTRSWRACLIRKTAASRRTETRDRWYHLTMNSGADGARMRFLFATAETHPTHRADVRVLFGKYLPQFGIETDLVATGNADSPPARWGGGEAYIRRARTRLGFVVADVVQQLSLFRRCLVRRYDGLIVRDKPFLGVVGLAAARTARITFVYWMSFPMPEAYLVIARSEGETPFRRLYAGVRGRLGSMALYRLIVPNSDHLFVQSAVMLEELRAKGLRHSRATPVPMGVDVEGLSAPTVSGSEHRPNGATHRYSAVYLGTLSYLRRAELEVMVDAAIEIGATLPDFVLLVIGESDTESERGWLRRYAESRGGMKWVRFYGWLPYEEGLALARTCAVGLSPFPRGELFDSASPTKAIEYLALGLPVVCNDQPDQRHIIQESGGGFCVELSAAAFARAILQLVRDPSRAGDMGTAGQRWVYENRAYRKLAKNVTDSLRSIRYAGR